MEWTRLPFLIGLDGEPHVDYERAQAQSEHAERLGCCYLCGHRTADNLHRPGRLLRCRDEAACAIRYASLPEPVPRDLRMVRRAA